MQNLDKKNSGFGSAHPTFPFIVGSSSWENSTETHVQHSSSSNSLILNMGVPLHNYHNSKQSRINFHDQDSSSTLSTGQSLSEVDSMKEGNPCGQGMVSAQSGSCICRPIFSYPCFFLLQLMFQRNFLLLNSACWHYSINVCFYSLIRNKISVKG